MHKKLLAIFAHPDDEAFGPAGTLALYAQQGVEIHLLCVTSGEAGDNKIKNSKLKMQNHNVKLRGNNVALRNVKLRGNNVALRNSKLKINKGKIATIREEELLKSAKILGIAKVEFLGFPDGHLGNALYHQLADKIIAKIKSFKPQVVITFDQTGVSGHLDHIAVAMVTTFAFAKTRQAKKLYYHCLPRSPRIKEMDDYFIYFPEGYAEDTITTRIDISSVWGKRIAAVKTHQSQLKDINRVMKFISIRPKIDHFILQFHRGIKVKFPETDLFAGIYNCNLTSLYF